MPITLQDAPGTLPSHGKEIYVSAFNSAYDGTCKDKSNRDECSARIAWSAVKSKFSQNEDGDWTPKSEVQEFSMAIVKASYDKATATRRWRAVASDTEEDSYKDSMSLELFEDFMQRIESEELPPEEYRSDFWSGGKPYLSVSHYPDFNGKGVPGPVDTVYIDGNRLKSTGRFDDTPIGRACFESVCKDLYSEDPVPDDEKIRISIAFLDYKHRHKKSGVVFERSDGDKICMECLKEMIEGEFDGKEFLSGHLIHLGMTRVPVNKRTEMEVERSMTTKKEDAASIIGEDLAEELEQEENKMVGKSEALVIKAEDETVTEEVEEETPEAEPVEEEVQEEKSDFEGKMLRLLEEIKSEVTPEPVEEHPLDSAITQLKSVFDVAAEMDDSTAALQAVQEPFEALVRSIQENLVQPEQEEVPETAEGAIAKMLSDFRQEIGQEMGLLRAEISAAKSVPVIKEQPQPTAPARRSVPPELVLQPPQKAPKSETPNLRAIVDRSVGL
jgi:cation transport regulator